MEGRWERSVGFIDLGFGSGMGFDDDMVAMHCCDCGTCETQVWFRRPGGGRLR